MKKQTLKAYFGYDTFRPGQEPIIEHILSGQDVLAVMPTGAGKPWNWRNQDSTRLSMWFRRVWRRRGFLILHVIQSFP